MRSFTRGYFRFARILSGKVYRCLKNFELARIQNFSTSDSLRWGEREKKKKRKRRYDPEDTEREAKVSTRIENLEKPYENLSHFCIMRKVGVEYTHLEWKNKVIHSGV